MDVRRAKRIYDRFFGLFCGELVREELAPDPEVVEEGVLVGANFKYIHREFKKKNTTNIAIVVQNNIPDTVL